MDHEEIEVKFYVSRMDVLRQRLLDLGASSIGRVFEKNIRFEDAEESLIAARALLRLRHDGKNILTYKQATASGDDQFKVYREIETEVSDYEATRKILGALGYFPRQAYEKYRETFTFNGAVICLDTMPYGDFLEIEGEKRRIRELSDGLGLDWDKRILATYLEMFAYISKTVPLEFEDLTFDNFSSLQGDFSSCWQYFEQRASR